MTGRQALDRRAERIRLANGRAAVEVAPGVGGRIAALEVDGWDVLRRDGWTDNEWGAFVMAPWVGRLRDAAVAWDGRRWSVPSNEPPHALHGLVAAEPWSVALATSGMVRLERTLGPGWPTGGSIVHTVTLHADRLELRLQVHAEREPVPVIVGWHPWFRRYAVRAPGDSGREAPRGVLRPDDRPDQTGHVALDIDYRRRVGLDAAGLPTGALLDAVPELVDDVLLGVAGAPLVHWSGGPSLALRSPGAAAWIVYTAHPDGICVEPASGIPDGLNGGLLGEPPVARPGRPVDLAFEIAWG